MSFDNITAAQWDLAEQKLLNCDSGTKLKRSRWRRYTLLGSKKKVKLTQSFMIIDGNVYAFATGKLGRGHFGEVKLVKNRAGAVFSIKISEIANEREAQILMDYNIQKAQIARRLREKKSPKYYYLMECLGENLKTYLDKKKPNFTQRIDISLQCASQLRDVHTGKISRSGTKRGHFDVKETNYVIKDGQVRLIDFGLSREFSETDKVCCGTEGYRAPEVANFKGLSPAADVYSLGQVLININQGNRQMEELGYCMQRVDPSKRPTLDSVEVSLIVMANTSDATLIQALQGRGYDYTVEEAKAISITTFCECPAYDRTNILVTKILALAWDYIRQYNNIEFTYKLAATETLVKKLLANPGADAEKIKDNVREWAQSKEAPLPERVKKASEVISFSRAAFFNTVLEEKCRNEEQFLGCKVLNLSNDLVP